MPTEHELADALVLIGVPLQEWNACGIDKRYDLIKLRLTVARLKWHSDKSVGLDDATKATNEAKFYQLTMFASTEMGNTVKLNAYDPTDTLTPHCDSRSIDCRSKVRSHVELGQVLSKVYRAPIPQNEWLPFCKKNKDNLFGYITNIESFADAMREIPSEMQPAVFVAIKDQLMQCVRDNTSRRLYHRTTRCSCFNALLKSLHSDAQRTDIYFCMKDELPSFVQSYYDVKDIMEPLNADQRTEFFNAIKDRLVDLTQYSVGVLADVLTPEQHTELYVRIKSKLDNADITRSSTFELTMKFLSPEQRVDYYNLKKEMLHQLIKYPSDVVNIFKYLSVEQKTDAYNRIKPVLLPLIDSMSHFGEMLKALDSDQQSDIYNTIKDNIIQLILKRRTDGFSTDYDCQSFSNMFLRLHPEPMKRMFDDLQDKIPHDFFCTALWDTNSKKGTQQRNTMMLWMKEMLPEFISSVDDISWFFDQVPTDTCMLCYYEFTKKHASTSDFDCFMIINKSLPENVRLLHASLCATLPLIIPKTTKLKILLNDLMHHPAMMTQNNIKDALGSLSNTKIKKDLTDFCDLITKLSLENSTHRFKKELNTICTENTSGLISAETETDINAAMNDAIGSLNTAVIFDANRKKNNLLTKQAEVCAALIKYHQGDAGVTNVQEALKAFQTAASEYRPQLYFVKIKASPTSWDAFMKHDMAKKFLDSVIPLETPGAPIH